VGPVLAFWWARSGKESGISESSQPRSGLDLGRSTWLFVPADGSPFELITSLLESSTLRYEKCPRLRVEIGGEPLGTGGGIWTPMYCYVSVSTSWSRTRWYDSRVVLLGGTDSLPDL
jgi:hypothetical protein